MKIFTLLAATGCTAQILGGAGLYAPYGQRVPVVGRAAPVNVARAAPYASIGRAPVAAAPIRRAPVAAAPYASIAPMAAAPVMRAPIMRAPVAPAPAPAPKTMYPSATMVDNSLRNIEGLRLQTIGESINALNWDRNLQFMGGFPVVDDRMARIGNGLIMAGRFTDADALQRMIDDHYATTPPDEVNMGMVTGMGHWRDMFTGMGISVLLDIKEGTIPVMKGTKSSKAWLFGRNGQRLATQGAYDYAESQFYDGKISEYELDLAYKAKMESDMLVASQLAYLAADDYATGQPIGDLMLVTSADWGLSAAEDKLWAAEDKWAANPTIINEIDLEIAEMDVARAESEKMARVMDFNMDHALWEVFWAQSMEIRTAIEELKLEKQELYGL